MWPKFGHCWYLSIMFVSDWWFWPVPISTNEQKIYLETYFGIRIQHYPTRLTLTSQNWWFQPENMRSERPGSSSKNSAPLSHPGFYPTLATPLWPFKLDMRDPNPWQGTVHQMTQYLNVSQSRDTKVPLECSWSDFFKHETTSLWPWGWGMWTWEMINVMINTHVCGLNIKHVFHVLNN